MVRDSWWRALQRWGECSGGVSAADGAGGTLLVDISVYLGKWKGESRKVPVWGDRRVRVTSPNRQQGVFNYGGHR
ncbi:hypothetical protein [Anatilimnocola aggregata]|uniref:hypothetical protein n=1 Tax=Anatilimnocola aggregata TaxID=2528021 RepID=UPI00119FA1C5|nr:hypothetical protein [Anatilimnocola aggregata]